MFVSRGRANVSSESEIISLTKLCAIFFKKFHPCRNTIKIMIVSHLIKNIIALLLLACSDSQKQLVGGLINIPMSSIDIAH